MSRTMVMYVDGANGNEGVPRAYGIAPKVGDARKEAKRQLQLYIEKKRALGEVLDVSDFKERVKRVADDATPPKLIPCANCKGTGKAGQTKTDDCGACDGKGEVVGGVFYLVIIPNAWGRGATLKEADDNARSHGGFGKRKVKRIVYRYDASKTPAAWCNEMGAVSWYGARPEEVSREDAASPEK